MNVSTKILRWMALNGRIGRLGYLAFGVTLMVLKGLLDWLLVVRIWDREWSWTNYLPTAHSGLAREWTSWGHSRDSGTTGRWFIASLLLLSAPFVWAGIVLTVRRLRAAGLPIWLAALFFVPILNFILFAVLCVVPSKSVKSGDEDSEAASARGLRSERRGFWKAIVLCVGVGWICAHANAYILGIYGAGLFVGLPFALGVMSAVIYGSDAPRSRRGCANVAIASVAFLGLVLFVTMFEGLICLLMASPIWIACAGLGGLVGHAVQLHARDEREVALVVMSVLVAIPALLGAEAAALPPAPIFETQSVIEINAPPQRVWASVVSFPDLKPPTEWMFRAGVAYPIGATIVGRGPGAERRCKFSTGDFVEPITVWDEPRLLRFDVTSNPEPMVEWSFSDAVHPPHLDGFMVSRNGEFRLVARADGGTRLEGSTWYQHHMWPASYWRIWSDHIIHTIHLRVLNHIRELSESNPTLAAQSDVGPDWPIQRAAIP